MLKDENTEKDEKYLLSSVYNTLEVLDLLSQHDGLGIAEISKSLKLSKSSVFRMLYTLEKKDFVYKTSDAKYRLSVKFAHYGSIVLDNLNIISIVKPYLKKLVEDHNETAHLGIIDDDLDVIFIAKESSTSSIQMTSRIGKKMPFYATATGKILLAYNLDDELEKNIKNHVFIKFTENTITDYTEFIKLLNETKKRGYAKDLEESEDGLTCYAVPVMDISGKVIAGISLSGPTVRMEKNKENILNSLKEISNEASRNLGFKK